MAVSGNFSKLSVAPMMDWTDRHCRLFLRMLSPHARLYAEMVTAAALIHGDAEKLLRFNPAGATFFDCRVAALSCGRSSSF